MRISFLNTTGQLGGAETSLLDVLASLRSAQPLWEFQVICGRDGPLAGCARDAGVSVSVLPMPEALARLGDAGAGGPAGSQVSRARLAAGMSAAAAAAPRYISSLRHELRAYSPDIVHTNGFKMHVLGAWARPNGASVVWHIHDYIRPRPVMSRLIRSHSRRCAAAVANSASVARDIEAACGPSIRVMAVYNAVDLDRFTPEGPPLDLDSLSGIPPAPEGTIRIGLPATMARWKGHDVFLIAIAMLPQEPPVRAYVIGGALYDTAGSQRSIGELRQLACELGIGERVGFTGFISKPAAAMRALDIVVHASTEPEPFGLVVAEAMACGRAVVMSDNAGIAELLELETDALAHSPGDPSSLAARLRELAADAELRRKLGAQARRTAMRQFDRARLAVQLVPFYEHILADRKTRDAGISVRVRTAGT